MIIQQTTHSKKYIFLFSFSSQQCLFLCSSLSLLVPSKTKAKGTRKVRWVLKKLVSHTSTEMRTKTGLNSNHILTNPIFAINLTFVNYQKLLDEIFVELLYPSVLIITA